MKNRTKDNINKLNRIADAWESLAPEAKFAGMALEQFKGKIKPALDKLALLNAIEAELSGHRRELVDLSNESYGWGKKVVKSVRGDVDYGDDCPLYSAMGFVRSSERKSGLTRKAQAAAAAAKKTTA